MTSDAVRCLLQGIDESYILVGCGKHIDDKIVASIGEDYSLAIFSKISRSVDNRAMFYNSELEDLLWENR